MEDDRVEQRQPEAPAHEGEQKKKGLEPEPAGAHHDCEGTRPGARAGRACLTLWPDRHDPGGCLTPGGSGFTLRTQPLVRCPLSGKYMENRLVLLGMLAVAACSGGDNTGPERLSLNGTWSQSGDLKDSVTGDSHIHVGTFALSQSGDNFSGTGEQSGFCSTSASTSYTGPLADPTPFAVAGGVLVDRDVTFHRDICDYQGHFVSGRTDRLNGTATCHYNRNGVDYTFTGQWQATKQ